MIYTVEKLDDHPELVGNIFEFVKVLQICHTIPLNISDKVVFVSLTGRGFATFKKLNTKGPIFHIYNGEELKLIKEQKWIIK